VWQNQLLTKKYLVSHTKERYWGFAGGGKKNCAGKNSSSAGEAVNYGLASVQRFFFLRTNGPLGNVFCGEKSIFEHGIFRYLKVNL
jgi:hypothetical protein